MPINSFLYPGAKVTTGYEVANSCRFNDDDSPYLHKNVGTPTNDKIFTVSCWLKICSIGDERYFVGEDGGTDNYSTRFQAGDGIYWQFDNSGANKMQLNTNQVFRDPSAWYHIVTAYDSTQSTASDRAKLYVNGTRVTSFSTETYPSQNEAPCINKSGNNFRVGSHSGGSYFDGYIAEYVFIDGTQYAASDFGEFDEDSPTIWKPKDVSGLTFGNNGFYLDFEDSSNLGNDKNGGTDLTEVNLAATDQATDTPTNNFATWNSLENYYQSNTYSEGNCQVQTQSTSFTYNFATIGVSAGKWYWEVEYDALSGGNDQPSIGITSTPPTANDHELGNFANDWGWYTDNNTGYQANNNSYSDIDLNDYTVGDIIGVALDLTNNKLYFRKNGTWEKSGDPTSGSTGTGAISITAPGSTPLGAYFPSVADGTNSQNATFKANFGGCSAFTVSSGNSDANGYGNFEYSVPSGYYALCTKNLAEFG